MASGLQASTASPSADLIRLLEELQASAWPAEVVEALDGWRLRFTWGVTSRANSVWPHEHLGQLPLADKLTRVEEFYQRWGGGARYHISPAAQPADLDAALAARGYRAVALTHVQTAPLAVVLADPRYRAAHRITLSDHLDEAWFAIYGGTHQAAGPSAEVRRGILRRIAPRAAYVTAHVAGEAAAVGLGVLERGWLGVYSMATRPELRRQGAARAVLHALAAWGAAAGAANMYLQVVESNVAARPLYEGIGFRTQYQYHYRELTHAQR